MSVIAVKHNTSHTLQLGYRMFYIIVIKQVIHL